MCRTWGQFVFLKAQSGTIWTPGFILLVHDPGIKVMKYFGFKGKGCAAGMVKKKISRPGIIKTGLVSDYSNAYIFKKFVSRHPGMIA